MLKPNIPVILLSTGLVILVGAMFFPIWFYFDPVLNIVKHLNIIVSTSSENMGSVSKSNSKLTSSGKEKMFTKEELAMYGANAEGDKVYLGILGSVFDVSKGKKHYGRGGDYSFFSGRDGTRAFMTGEFNEEGLTDDIRALGSEHCFALAEWVKFYEKDYKYVGKVIGNFYDEKGTETDELKRFWKEVDKAKENQASENAVKKIFPDCNSKWSQDEGAFVWCTIESGGVHRDWIGVPRMFFTPGQANHRCACVKEENLDDARVKNYPSCDSKATKCAVKEGS